MKKTIIFFSTPAYGHILAEYPIIKRLVDMGYNVDWYSTENFKSIVSESGANFKVYKEDFDELYDLANVTSDFYKLMQTLLELNKKCFLDYINEIDKDEIYLILYDSMCSFAKNIAQVLNINSVCLCSTLAYNFFTFTFSNMLLPSAKLTLTHIPNLINMIKNENRFRKENRIKKLNIIDLFVNSGDITIVLTLKELQPFVNTFPNTFKFVGTTIKDKICMKKQEYSNYDIYISAGSIWTENENTENILNKALGNEYFKDKKIILNVGNSNIKFNNNNIECTRYTDQISLLKKCKLFVNHGGINSIYDSISNKVPQICIPKQEEQRMNAIIMKRNKIGYYIRNFNISQLQYYEGKIKKYNNNIEKYANLINNTDGTTNAVNLIIEMIGNDE